ncbi:MAG: transposase [Gammaproteobacteria bacterium]|nr:transposase [Gammaproteobacteria bacterium]
MDHRLEYFEAFVERIAAVRGHADRREPFADYCTGLLLPGERKSVKPMSAQVSANLALRMAEREHVMYRW